jgi:small subunit ribosomal protein S33
MSILIPQAARLRSLAELRCSILGTLYNPQSTRSGTKYLRSRLRGPSMVNYYPQELSFKDINRMHPELKLVDFAEEQRLFDVDQRKKRGKGTPKKAKTKGMFTCLFLEG